MLITALCIFDSLFNNIEIYNINNNKRVLHFNIKYLANLAVMVAVVGTSSVKISHITGSQFSAQVPIGRLVA